MPSVNSTSLSSIKTAAQELKKHVTKADQNRDGLVSTDEIKKYGNALGDGFVVGNALLTMQSWSLRQAESRGSKVAVRDLKSTIDQAVNVISTKDTNRNKVIDGAEVKKAERLKTFKALAALAAKLEGPAETLTAAKLGAAIATHAPAAVYMSESDSTPEFLSKPGIGTAELTADRLQKALKSELDAAFDSQDEDDGEYTTEAWSTRDTNQFLAQLTTDDDVENSNAWKAITTLLKQNLTDLKVFKYGPKDARTGRLAEDSGSYQYIIAGKSADGRIAGIMFSAVET